MVRKFGEKKLADYSVQLSVLHTENVARGDKLSFQNVGGVKVYTIYLLFKTLGGRRPPCPPNQDQAVYQKFGVF